MSQSVLIVDSDPARSDAKTGLFAGSGLVTRRAHSLNEALDAVAAETPALVVLDLNLSAPGFGAYYSMLKAAHPELQFLFITIPN